MTWWQFPIFLILRNMLIKHSITLLWLILPVDHFIRGPIIHDTWAFIFPLQVLRRHDLDTFSVKHAWLFHHYRVIHFLIQLFKVGQTRCFFERNGLLLSL